MDINQAQEQSDKICKRLRIPSIAIYINPRLKAVNGIFKGGGLCADGSILPPRIHFPKGNIHTSTLIHELAHHLVQERFNRKVKGYYKAKKWLKMIPCKERKGQFTTNGSTEYETVYINICSPHGKQFRQCLRNVMRVAIKIGLY